MTNEEYFKALEERLDQYTIEETIERLEKNKEKSITLQKWMNHQDDEFEKLCHMLQLEDPEGWDEAVAWAQEYLKDFKICGE